MYFDKKDISNLEKYNRINLINSITGIKPALLVGTKSIENGTNLAIFSSIVHISSNPPLLGFFLRTNKKIRRDTFENIIQNNEYTFNHINLSFIKRAHNTSIKFEKTISEFDMSKLIFFNISLSVDLILKHKFLIVNNLSIIFISPWIKSISYNI